MLQYVAKRRNLRLQTHPKVQPKSPIYPDKPWSRIGVLSCQTPKTT